MNISASVEVSKLTHTPWDRIGHDRNGGKIALMLTSGPGWVEAVIVGSHSEKQFKMK